MTTNSDYQHRYKEYTLNYKVFGTGKEVVLCFHGFSEDSHSFAYLEQYGARYTFYAFDFFFHGKTNVPNKKMSLGKEQWAEIITSFLQDRRISQVRLLGYSMGGRLSLVLAEYIPERITAVMLIAPDGIAQSFWFRFATANPLGKILFKQATFHPRPFHALFDFLHWMKVVPRRLYRMAKHNTRNPERREQVYWTWQLLSPLHLDLQKIERSIDNHNITMHIILGRYDKVIPLDKISRWSWAQKHSEQVLVLEHGHIIPSTALLESMDHAGFI